MSKMTGAINITLSTRRSAMLDDVVADLIILANALGRTVTVTYNLKQMIAEPGDSFEKVLRRYAGEQHMEATRG